LFLLLLTTNQMSSFIIIATITSLVIGILLLLERACSIWKILFQKHAPRKHAVEIDHNEHVYAHPDYTSQLKEFNSIDVQTVYDVLLRGLQVGGDRPQFSFRNSSDQPFKSYTYK
jgi:hypothetical protein